jgi:hypothetical protein
MSALLGLGPYMGDICAWPGCGHSLNFHLAGATYGRCLRIMKRGPPDRDGVLPPTEHCDCPGFVQSEADAHRDRRGKQASAVQGLAAVEAAIAESFDPTEQEKVAPLLRRIRAICQRAMLPPLERGSS